MSRKLANTFLSLVLLLSLLQFQPKALASIGEITVNSSSVNVRGGPGLSFPIVQKVNKNDRFSVLKKEGDWIQIDLGKGKKAWIANWLATNTKKEQKSSSSKLAEVIVDNLRVRNGPGTNFSITSYLKVGQTVTVLEDEENWIKISSSTGQGWVAREFLKLQVKESTASKPGTSKSVKSQEGIVQDNSVNVRSTPSLNSTVIGKLQKNSKVKILSVKDSWSEISFNGKTAWVSSEFISAKNPKDSGKSAVPVPEGIIGTVTATTLNLRDSASLNSKVIGSVKKGQSFKIIEELNSWTKLEISPNKYGWVGGWYLEKTVSEKKSNDGQAITESTVTILHSGTNIRKSPNVKAEVIYRGSEHENFEVKSLKNDWYEIILPDGRSGYVAGWIVTVDGSAPKVEKSGPAGYLKGKVIIIDPGHGGGDNGTTGARGTREKELTIRTARLLYEKLKASGANAILTRGNDTYLSLRARVSTSHYHRADAFISIHYDSIVDRSVRGMTSYFYHSYQKSLAETLHSNVISQTKLKNRGTRFGDYHVLRENKQNAVLLELGYLSNPSEELVVTTSQYQETAASGIYSGLARYFMNN